MHGLTTLLIDQRTLFLGVATDDAQRQARLACTAILEGLSASPD